jgi:hypothetical protein
VHTFPPLCNFLCIGIQIGKVNTKKLKGAQSWHFLQVRKTMSLNPSLLLFLLFTFFFYFLVVLCLWLSCVLLSCSPLSFLLCRKLKGPRSELNQHVTLINAFFKQTRPQILTGHLIVMLPFVLFLYAGSSNLLGYLVVLLPLCIFLCARSWTSWSGESYELTLPSHPSTWGEETLLYPLWS